jgi:HK97 family phage prohead protease
MERRIAASEVRATGVGKEMRVSGYAARYNSLSNKLGDCKNSFRERIASGAFNRILSTKPDVVFLLNHDVNHVLGRTSAGTLTLRSDDKGLAYDCLLPNTQAGRDTHESVKRGDLRGASFAFNLGERMDAWGEEDEIEDEKDLGLRGRSKGKKMVVRTIRDFSSLMDCSVVTYPAYDQTSAAARHNVVAAEVRSHVATFRTGVVRGSTPMPAGIERNFGVYYVKDDSADQLVIARRKQLNNFLLS